TMSLAATVFVNPGAHLVRFERNGYISDEEPLQATEHTSLQCELRPQQPMAAKDAATLRIQGAAHLQVTVDSVQFHGQSLPAGRHVIGATSPGYRPWSETVLLPAGATTTLPISLTPTPETESEHRSKKASRQKTAAYVVAAAGAVIGGAAVTLF